MVPSQPHIQGDQALPQPDERLEAELEPTLPEPVLRREAWLRSWRWVFAITGGLLLLGLGSNVVGTAIAVSGGVSARAVMFAILPHLVASSLSLTMCVVLFWALSHPRKATRLVLRLAVLVALANLGRLIWGAAQALSSLDFGGISAGYKPFLIINTASSSLEFFLVIYVWILAEKGPSRELYSPAGLEYFAREDAPRLKENYWLCAIYGFLLAVRLAGTMFLVRIFLSP
jgi:hypothetical protein